MESLKNGHFSRIFDMTYLQITLYLKKTEPFCQILQKAVSDYQALISSGLFTAYALGVLLPYLIYFPIILY